MRFTTVVLPGLLSLPFGKCFPAPVIPTPAGDNTSVPYPVNKNYVSTGDLHSPPPKPFTPAGGLALNETPIYHPLSDFDFQSINLALYQEWIELDLFRYVLERFSEEEFDGTGLDAEDRYLIDFMRAQEVGHATLFSNILGPAAAKPCTYQYPFNTVSEFVSFSKKMTRVGEAGVAGFLEHLDSRASAQMVLQTVTTEARQQANFRQFEGLFPMPVWFQTAITQSMQWTIMQRYIVSCPKENRDHPLIWQVFPGLNITNNPNSTDPAFGPDITNNRTALSFPGREVILEFESPGKPTGPDGLYVTSSTAKVPAMFAGWISQLNVTYTPVYDVVNEEDIWSAKTKQPNVPEVFPGLTNEGDPVVNGTVFLVLVDEDLYVTPANLSMLNDHVVAGPALYQVG